MRHAYVPISLTRMLPRILRTWPVRARETVRVGSDTIYNIPATPDLAIVTSDSYLGS
jgi:hypothetical protein